MRVVDFADMLQGSINEKIEDVKIAYMSYIIHIQSKLWNG
jgi:hypothetical protein